MRELEARGGTFESTHTCDILPPKALQPQATTVVKTDKTLTMCRLLVTTDNTIIYVSPVSPGRLPAARVYLLPPKEKEKESTKRHDRRRAARQRILVSLLTPSLPCNAFLASSALLSHTHSSPTTRRCGVPLRLIPLGSVSVTPPIRVSRIASWVLQYREREQTQGTTGKYSYKIRLSRIASWACSITRRNDKRTTTTW